ncbi:MAG: colanic acid biosynthesis glycosyltransferase WcaL, partial [Algicola sp.]|nr:colanic acid biosynthesis glycosyltransferase WcaL [Algicola sp.]
MKHNSSHKPTIGIVLSTVPKYSETFFRNKIKGLIDYGFNVILFVDYTRHEDVDFQCKVVTSYNFNVGLLNTFRNSCKAIFKTIFYHPKRSYLLYQLNKKDGLRFKTNIKQLIVNQFLLTHNLDWLHFGFGMLAVNRENVAESIEARMAVSFRGFDLYLSPLKHEGCYNRLFSKNVNYHVLSEEMKSDLIKQQINQDRITVITPAINVSFFNSEKTKIQGKPVKIITVARLHWKKGLEYTLEALKILEQMGCDFHFTIIGEGGEYERLMFAAHQLQIMHKVSFKGKLPHESVKEHLEASDIYLQYSVQEGFCNAVLEAQAMGLMLS